MKVDISWVRQPRFHFRSHLSFPKTRMFFRVCLHFCFLHAKIPFLYYQAILTVEEYTDLIAERVTTLGGTAEGTVRVSAQKSSLEQYPLEITDGRDHVEALSSALAQFAKLTRANIDDADEAGDMGTADLLTEVSRGTDKLLWLVEAQIQG